MKGQTLIETILAVAVIGIIVSGLSVLVVSALSNAGFVRNQSLATEYAQEGIEVLRSIRNNNYATFAGYDSTSANFYCLAKDAIVLTISTSACDKNIDLFYKRSVTIDQNGCQPGISEVSVEVKWTDSKCETNVFCHKSQVTSCLSTINPVTAP